MSLIELKHAVRLMPASLVMFMFDRQENVWRRQNSTDTESWIDKTTKFEVFVSNVDSSMIWRFSNQTLFLNNLKRAHDIID